LAEDDNEWQDVPKKPKPGGGVAVADEWEDVAPPKGQPQTPEALAAAKAKVAQPTKFELAHVGKAYITPEQEEANKKAWGWYAPTISDLQRYGAGASNLLHQGYQGVKEAAGGIRDIASDISSKRPLFFGGETPETESTFHKYITAPAEAESKKAQQAPTALESIGHSVAATIPFLGPLAANIAEQGGTGDVGGAVARAAGQYYGAKTIGKVAKGAIPEIKVNPEAVGARAAEALGGAEAPNTPAVEVHRPPIVKTAKNALRAIGNPYGLASTPEELITQGISPRASALGWKQNLPRVTEDLKRYSMESPINSVQDLHDAIPEIKDKIWTEEVNPALERQGQRPVDMKPVAEAVRKQITPEMREFDEGNANDLQSMAEKLEGARDIGSANRLLKYVNGKLDAYFSKFPAARRSNLMANPETAGWEAARQALRNQFLQTLEEAGETGVRDARQRYGALEGIGNEVERRVNVADRQKPMSLSRILGIMGAPMTLGLSVVAGELGHYLNKPDVLVRRGIRNIAEPTPRAEVPTPAPFVPPEPPPAPPMPEELNRQARATAAPPPRVAPEFAKEEIPSGEENEFELARGGGVVSPKQPGIAGLLPPAEVPRGLLPKHPEEMPMGEPEQGPAARIPEINIQRKPATGRMQKVFMGTSQPEVIGRTEAGPIYERQPPIEAAQKAAGIIPEIGKKTQVGMPRIAESKTHIDIIEGGTGKILKSYKNTPLGKELAQQDLPRWEAMAKESAGGIPEIRTVKSNALRAGDTFIDEKGDPRRVVRVNEDGTVETQDGAPKTYKDEVEMRGDLNTPKSLVAQGGKIWTEDEVAEHPELAEVNKRELAKTAEKEPWQMTKDEYVKQQLPNEEARTRRKKEVGNLTLKQYHEQQHQRAVGGAVHDGKSVPDEVLADYPGLKESVETQKKGVAQEKTIAGDTESKYKDAEAGEWNPERVKDIHDPYVKMMTHGKVAEAQPTATVMMGGTASGKSTFAKPLFEKNHNLVRIEADHAKMNIPEYEEFQKSDPQNAAWRVHEESSRMAKQTMAQAVKNKLSFVYDATSAGNGGPELVQRLKDVGYKVHLRLVDVPTDFAVKEATRRATESADPANRGRFVPEEAIREVHQGAADKFLRMTKMLDDAVPGSDAHAIDNRNRDFKTFYEKEAGKPETIHDRQTFEYLKNKAAGRESVQNAPGVLRPLAEKARPETGGAVAEGTSRGPAGNRGGPERGIREINVPKDLTLTELPSKAQGGKNWKALFFKGTDPATGTVTKMGHMEMAPESGNRVRVALSAVMDGFEGRGIGTEMYRKALDYAKEKGYKAVVSDYKGGTGEYPASIWKKLGARQVKIGGQPAWQIDLKPMKKPTRISASE
jgi:predicted ABC-type ATPase/predicted GNAT family acetyltransferase